uniref:Uncharacterized protein n=1 Tax=Desertifilum tharense IPPAS B-1220 TaxID=1781255 RepID=A0ACD5GQ55_9CYAN
MQAATDIHLQLLPLFKALFITTNPIPLKTVPQASGLGCRFSAFTPLRSRSGSERHPQGSFSRSEVALKPNLCEQLNIFC